MKRIDECTNMTVLVALLVVGILLALYLNVCQKRERAAAERAEA